MGSCPDTNSNPKFRPKSVLEQFYFSIIFPSITYGYITWANGSNSELYRSIEKLHGWLSSELTLKLRK